MTMRETTIDESGRNKNRRKSKKKTILLVATKNSRKIRDRITITRIFSVPLYFHLRLAAHRTHRFQPKQHVFHISLSTTRTFHHTHTHKQWRVPLNCSYAIEMAYELHGANHSNRMAGDRWNDFKRSSRTITENFSLYISCSVLVSKS